MTPNFTYKFLLDRKSQPDGY